MMIMNKIKLKNGCYYVVEVSLYPGNIYHRAIYECKGEVYDYRTKKKDILWQPLTYESYRTYCETEFNRFKIIEHINSMDKKVSEIMSDKNE